MKNLLLVITGIFIFSACSNKYQHQIDLIIDRIQTVDENTSLELGVDILEIKLDTIVTTKDSINKFLEKWDYKNADRYDSLIGELEKAISNCEPLDKKCDSIESIYKYLADQPYRANEALKARDKYWDCLSKQIKCHSSVIAQSQLLRKIFDSIQRLNPYIPNEMSYRDENNVTKYYSLYYYKDYLEQKENHTYYIYFCKYKAFNPALNVNQTNLRRFIFNGDQTEIIRID